MFTRLCLISMIVGPISATVASSQDVLRSCCDSWREPILPGSLNAFRLQATSGNDAADSLSRDSQVRLFHMTTGYLSGSVGFIDTDSQCEPDLATLTPSDSDGPSRISVIAGNDNPYLDFRRPGDPGGVGYFRVNSQLQFLDNGRTGCTIGLLAATPAGLEFDGVQTGPTYVAPNFAWSYDLGDGAGLHGFVGKSVRAAGDWTDSLGRNVEYGLALHRPVPVPEGATNHNLFMFLEALGRVRPDNLGDSRRNVLEVLPGLHYRLNENWWMSGGLIVPVGSTRSDLGTWQVTCSWQF